jgi:enamine deaminase RidA (YjgF/YER057c/UK114 family)
MAKQVVETPGLFDSRPRGYVQCITSGELVFVAGQVGVDASGQVVSPEFAAQARQALQNVVAALEAAGVGPADITSLTVYLTDMARLREYSAIKQEVLGDIETTSTAIGVTALALPELQIEVTVMAVRGGA